MKKILKGKKGFTLIELMVVVVIVGILASVAVPLYRGQQRRARAAEGVALLGSVRTGQLVYYAEHETFKAIPTATSYDSDIGVDASFNRYFTEYTSTGGATFTATTTGTGAASKIQITINQTGDINIDYEYEP